MLYALTSQGLIISSEVQPILELGIKAKWNDNSLSNVLTHQYLLPGQTLFKDVNSIPPGEYLVFQNKKIIHKRYWDLSVSSTSDDDMSEGEAIEIVRQEVDDAVIRRIRSDVGISVALSGGLDSSVVSAIVSRECTSTLDSYGIRFDHEQYDEGYFSNTASQFIGSNHHDVPISRNELLDNLDDAVRASQSLTINGQLSSKYILMKRVSRDGHKVILTGEGADELFYGYSHLRQDYYGSSRCLEDNFSSGVMFPDKDALGSDEINQLLGFTPSFMKAKLSFCTQLHDCLESSYIKSMQNNKPIGQLVQSFNHIDHASPVKSSTYLWSKMALSGYILSALGDGCEMAHSLEGRPPFLDHHLYEKISSIPMKYHFQINNEKNLLRQAYKDLLPNSVLMRRKAPLLAPPLLLGNDNNKVWENINDRLRSRTFYQIPFWDHKRVIRNIEMWNKQGQGERVDPVLFMILSSISMQASFGMSS